MEILKQILFNKFFNKFDLIYFRKRIEPSEEERAKGCIKKWEDTILLGWIVVSIFLFLLLTIIFRR